MQKIFSNNGYVYIFSGIYLLISFVFSGTPFFWDMGLYSEMSHYILENNFNLPLNEMIIRNGNPTFYALYHAVLWKIFGRSLLISHLALLPFIIGLLWQINIFAKKYIKQNYIIAVFILLLVEPTIFTQYVLMGYDIVIAFLFFLALNCMIKKNTKLYILALCCLIFVNMRGMVAGYAVIILQLINSLFIESEKFRIKNLIPLFSVTALAVSVHAYHYSVNGWFLISPHSTGHRDLMNLQGMLYNSIFISWKILDFGRVLLVMFIFISSIYLLKNKNQEVRNNIFEINGLIIATAILVSFPLILFSNPISYRYFIIIYILIIISVVNNLQYLKSKAIYIVFLLLFAANSVLGNFWKYPVKYGNGWDSSMKHYPYFELFIEAKEYIKNMNIDVEDVGTRFPMWTDIYHTDLVDEKFLLSNVGIGGKDMLEFKYILYSNINNNYSVSEFEVLKANFILEKSFEKGFVYVNLYRIKD